MRLKLIKWSMITITLLTASLGSTEAQAKVDIVTFPLIGQPKIGIHVANVDIEFDDCK